MSPSLQQVVDDAVAQGVLPPGTTPPRRDSRPWPVVLLTALGAWLAALPLLGMIGLLLGDLIARGVGPYAIGGLLLAGAVVVLRSAEVPVFIEQLALPALLSGAGALAMGLGRDLPPQAAASVLVAVALAVALLVPRPWLRALLGAGAAGLFSFALLPGDRFGFMRPGGVMSLWLALHASFLLWLVAMAVQRQVLGDGTQARAAQAVESVGAGWLLAVLAALAWLSGLAFLVPGVMGGGFAGHMAREMGGTGGMFHGHGLASLGSVVLALGASFHLARVWPGLRTTAGLVVAAVLAVLGGFIPELGAALLALALALGSGRWRLAAACALAGIWMLGAFYYALEWPLGYKAAVLVACGAALGAPAWGVLRAHRPATTATPRGSALTRALIATTAVATLGLVNLLIGEKHALIASGERLYVELAPVDPRSLMQGDYMRLNFNLPPVDTEHQERLLRGARPSAVAVRDEQQVARFLRLHSAGEVLAPGEFRVQLTPKDGRWVLVTDAWFFREGDGARWAQARYGEFRVTPDGTALLVGMADARRNAIRP